MRVDLLALEEARSHVPLLQHRDVRHVHQLAVLSRQVEDALQRGQLAVDLAVRDLPLLPVFAFAERPSRRSRRFRMNVLTSAVVIVASRRPPKCGKQVQPNPPLEFVGRPPAVDGVFGLEIVGRLVEPDPIQLRVHRQAVRDVSFADLQQLIASDSLLLPLDSRSAGRSGSTSPTRRRRVGTSCPFACSPFVVADVC